MNLNEIKTKLESIAYAKTIPFCYGCYQKAPTGRCKDCFSDDLMRLLPDYGVEWGTCWVIETLIDQNLTPIDDEEVFSQMISECYSETTKVGFLELDTVSVMKDQDPIAFNIAQSEYMDSLLQDEQVITFDNGANYFWIHDVEQYIEENLPEEAA